MLVRPRSRRGSGHRLQHFRRDVDGDDLRHMGRGAVADMAAAAAQIQHAGAGPAGLPIGLPVGTPVGQDSFNLVQVGAAGMDGAGDVGIGARAVAVGDEAVVTGGHGVASRLAVWLVRARSPLLQTGTRLVLILV